MFANRTHADVQFTMAWPEGEVRRHTLPPNDIVPIPVSNQVEIIFQSGGKQRRHVARANSLHYFVTRSGRLDAALIRLPGLPDAATAPTPAEPSKRNTSLCVIPVKILVDDDEPAARRVWEQRLRQRFDEASDVFEHYCRTRFKVVAVGTWESDDSINDFPRSMREFERKASPNPARLAVGFTSQYEIPNGRTHLAGIRKALYSHILVREWSQHVTRMERLEVLIHELGHFLGAAHSLQPTSVMRPTLGDHRAHDRFFRIGFDPLNAFAMCLVCEELRAGDVKSIDRLSAATKTRLQQVYTSQVKLMPSDPVARQCITLLRREQVAKTAPAGRSASLSPQTSATWSIVRTITKAAQQNHASASPLEGDRLTEYYVRRAAAAADKLPRDVAGKALLLGLGIAMDDSSTLRSAPLMRGLCRQVDSDQQRTARLAVLGKPTMHQRHDLAKHFFVSSAMAALTGPHVAEAIGLKKELSDAKEGGTGFSFADLSADIAGVTFATKIYDGKIDLATVAKSFAVKAVLPGGADLKEGIAWKEFVAMYGSVDDDRFRREVEAIRKRVLAMPGFRTR